MQDAEEKKETKKKKEKALTSLWHMEINLDNFLWTWTRASKIGVQSFGVDDVKY